MKKLLITIAAAALVTVPLAAHAQDRDGWQGDGQGGYARPAAGYGHDADAQVQGDRRGDTRYDRTGRDRSGFGRDRAGQDRFDGDRGFYGDRGDGRFRGEVGIGFGYGGYGGYGGDGYYGGYDGGGYYDAYPGDYGAAYAYSYPDEDGTYQPFDYGYSTRDQTYYADGGAAAYGGESYDRYQAAPNAGWSRGAGQDCGQWVWREGRGAYQWVPAPCL